MSALTDLQVSGAAIADGIGRAIALIQELRVGAVPAADVEAVVAQLNDLKAQLDAALNPPPTPAP